MEIRTMYEKMANKQAWDFDTAPLKIEYVNEKDIHQKTTHLSDISVHLPLLKFLAHQCDYIVEFGVREGNSTSALLAGKPISLISVDINPTTFSTNEPTWRFIQYNSVDPNLLNIISSIDMLVIDSLHEYEHCLKELRMWHNLVRKWIVLHDTVSCPGVAQAIKEFLVYRNKDWFIAYDSKINHGMMVLQR